MTDVDDMPKLGWVYRRLLHKDAKLSKLIPGTKEDQYHIHKTLGILSLVSFFYRYGYAYNTQGTLGFDGRRFDWLTMFVHSGLALSALLFRVPLRRIPSKPMVIYEEYRLHAIVFTLRCLVVFAVATLLGPNAGLFAPLGVMIMHLLADRVTAMWGTDGNTAVRATAASVKQSTFYRMVAKGYSFYQFLAIASHIVPGARHADMAFNALIAIQSSAFLMTLYRKRIIRGTTHMVVYGFCLVLSAFHIMRVIGLTATLATLAAFLVRINLPRKLSNKYVIWSAFLVFMHWDYVSQLFAMDQLPPVADIADVPTVRSSAAALLVYGAFRGERMLLGSGGKQFKSGKSRAQMEAEAAAAGKQE